MGRVWCRRAMELAISVHLPRYEDYVDQHYKEFLKNQGKVDSVRVSESGGRVQEEARGPNWMLELLPCLYKAPGSVPSTTKSKSQIPDAVLEISVSSSQHVCLLDCSTAGGCGRSSCLRPVRGAGSVG